MARQAARGVIGGSYGGYMVLSSLMHYGDRLVAKNEGHGLRKKENRDLYLLYAVMFLEKHLGLSGQ